MMAALGRDITRTNVFGSLAMVLLILLGGFALKRPDVVSCNSSAAGTSSKPSKHAAVQHLQVARQCYFCPAIC